MRAYLQRWSHLAPRATIRRLQRQIARKRWPESFSGDDYDWRAYSSEYRRELREMSRSYTQRLEPGDYSFEGEDLVLKESARPLHPNHRLLYETILQLGPQSVIEAGCGGGDHLHNLRTLDPGLDLTGFDRSEDQLSLLQSRSPDIADLVALLDLTMPLSEKLPRAMVVFTQAVLMHIHTGNGHLVALANLFALSQGQVILMENWTRHAFLDDITRLHADGMITWPNLYTYVRRSPELGNTPHLMVASSTELPYEPLTDYSVLTGS